MKRQVRKPSIEYMNKNIRILVVDDEAELLDLTVRTLKNADYKVSSAVSGTTCLKAVHKNKPDILLLGVMLPDADGRDICRKLKNDPEFSDIFIILFSSIETGSDDFNEGKEAGADGFISRPIENSELLIRIETACRIKTAEDEILRLVRRQKEILGAVPDIIMEVDTNKVYTWANKAGFEFFGEDVIGKEASFYFEGEQDTYARVEQVFKGSEIDFYVESWQRRCDDQKRLLGWHCRSLFDEEGNVKGAISSARDITGNWLNVEKISDTQLLLHACIDSPKDMIVLAIDNNYNYLAFNTYHKDVMLKAYGTDIKVGMNLLRCMTNEEDIVKAKTNYSRAMAGESHITIEEYGELSREYYETRYNPIYNNRNEIIGATAFSSSITERRRLIKGLEDSERSLQKKIEELEWLNQMMIGREIRMIELKKEINSLLNELGKDDKYIIHGSEQELSSYR